MCDGGSSVALAATKATRTFPSAHIRSHSGGLPIDVALIAQLGHGGGDQLIASASARQCEHEAFVDELDEPSARLGGIDLANGDATSLYSFAVGANGHPFHRHAGHRVVTAVSGSAGTQLRFSTASAEQIACDPHQFVLALHYVDIPPDCLFTLRFGGGTWHQFVPLGASSSHPAMFALSCHTNELGGDLAPELRERVEGNSASIPALTEVLPPGLRALLEDEAFDATRVPTIALSLDVAPMSYASRLCARMRGSLGHIRAALGKWRHRRGFLADNGGGRLIREVAGPPRESLLHAQWAGMPALEDSFELVTGAGEFATTSATAVLAAILDGFLENRPLGVSRLMALRNAAVKPLGLRTSPLGCPVSSLLSPCSGERFDGRFPVLAQRVDSADTCAEILLGVDDLHLAFRSSVGVEFLADGRARCTLGTRVRVRNLFGRVYMTVVDPVHRAYIAPTMLRLAVDHAVRRIRESSGGH